MRGGATLFRAVMHLSNALYFSSHCLNFSAFVGAADSIMHFQNPWDVSAHVYDQEAKGMFGYPVFFFMAATGRTQTQRCQASLSPPTRPFFLSLIESHVYYRHGWYLPEASVCR